MGLKERREREKKELREKILESARCLFVQKGYHSVTIRDIARLTEYSVPTLYSYLKDKESLIAELVREDVSKIERLCVESSELMTTAEDRLREFGLTSIRYLHSHPEQFRFLFQTSLERTACPESDAVRNKADGIVASCLSEIIGRSLSEQEIFDYRVLYLCDIHGILSMALGNLEQFGKLDLEKIYETKWQMLLQYFKSQRSERNPV